MTPSHETMDTSEMSAILEKAKEQQAEKNKKTLEQHKASKLVVNTSNANSDINSAKHGDYIETEDGIGGIVIDHEVEAEKMRSNDKTSKALMALLDTDGLISDANEYIPDYGEDAPEGYDPGVQYITENPYDPKTKEIAKIKEGFAELTYGLHGLVNKNSTEGRKVEEALEKLRSGEIVLPTPEEYEQQKKEAAERKKRRQQNNENNQNVTPTNISEPVDNTDDEYEMSGVPEDVVINKKGVDDLLNAINNETVEKNTQTPEPETTPEVNTNEKKVNAPINLAELEEEVNEVAEVQKEEEPTEELKPEDVVEKLCSFDRKFGDKKDDIISLSDFNIAEYVS